MEISNILKRKGLTKVELALLIGVVLILIITPIVIFWKDVEFDKAAFLTEYEKLAFDGIVLAGVIFLFESLRESNIERNEDSIYLRNHLLISLEYLNKVMADHLKSKGKNEPFEISPLCKFHWNILNDFFDKKIYFSIKNIDYVGSFCALHNELHNNGALRAAEKYFEHPTIKGQQVDFVNKKVLLEIKNVFHANKIS